MVDVMIVPADIEEIINEMPYDVTNGKMKISDVKLLLMDFYNKLDDNEF